ncbi:hypothetical protein V6U90_25545 [Micromonospora sp. CPCC 206060]|uniref:hypothetical protein n=1 Tax=Micromonospora sp. CPCC 206060 TaxID=3122406 RepID=UPI002FF02C29
MSTGESNQVNRLRPAVPAPPAQAEHVPGHGLIKMDDPYRDTLARRYTTLHVNDGRTPQLVARLPFVPATCVTCRESWPCAQRIWADSVTTRRLAA